MVLELGYEAREHETDLVGEKKWTYDIIVKK